VKVFRSRRDRFRAIALLVGIVLIFAIVFLAVSLVTDIFTDPESMREFLEAIGPYSPIIFILLMVLQVLFAPFPGQVAGLASGYLYGVFFGTLYAMIGSVLGSLLAFWLARRLGRPFVEKVVKEDVLIKFDYVAKQKAVFPLFLLFLLPALPDDAICFLAGLTRIPIWKLVIIAAIGRFPGMLVLNLAGAGIAGTNSTLAIVIFAVGLLISVPIFLLRKKLETLFGGKRPDYSHP